MPLPGHSCAHLLVAMQVVLPHTTQAPGAAGKITGSSESLSVLNLIVFVPGFLSVVALFRTSLTRVFLNIYLPVLLLLPLYFHIKLPGLPPIDFSEAVTVPLGCALVWRLWPTWKFSLVDVAMFVFILSAGASHFLTHTYSTGIFNIFFRLFEGLIPYLFGKLLIEQFDIRVATVRRIVVLLAAASVVSILEYFLGVNPFSSVWQAFFPNQGLMWITQFRWGFGRVAGPFGQSELAGIMLLVGIVLAIWVDLCYPWQQIVRNLGNVVRVRTVLLAILIITLFSTQARGPWLGTVLAVPVALLGRTRNLLRNSLIVLAICSLAGLAIYVKGKSYTSANPSSGEQQTAQYRAELIDDYVPIARQGGAWGWGEGFPVVHTASSIDNEYLFIWLVQGWVGMASFIGIALGGLFYLVLAIVRSTGKRDRFFALALLGIFCGILLTIGTVFLFGQPFQLFFLIAGWAQSVKTVRVHRDQRQFAYAHALT